MQTTSGAILCYDDTTDSFIDSIPLIPKPDWIMQIMGLAIDDSRDTLYVLIDFSKPESSEHVSTIQLFDSQSHNPLGQFDLEHGAYAFSPIINQKKQLMYLARDRAIQVVNLTSNTLQNEIPLPIDTQLGDQIYQIDYSPVMNCIVASVFQNSTPCLYIVYAPDEK